MPVSKINGVNINWRTVGARGRDNHPWVVMTTGGRRGHDEFVPLAEKIAAYGYRVMLHDRRNTGAVGRPHCRRRRRGGDLDARHARSPVRAKRAAGLFQRLVGRRSHLDAVLSALSASRAWPDAAARHGWSLCRRTAA